MNVQLTRAFNGCKVRSARAVLAISAFIIAACTAIPTSLGPIAVPLQYKTIANPGEFPALPQCAAISNVQAVDARSEKMIGKRYVETKPSVTAPVSSSSDVAAWVRAGAVETLRRAGVSQNTKGALLRLTVRQIVTTENVARRSGYEGRIVITAELRDRGGNRCWQDKTEGASENYGYSGTAENYQETLNHALDRAMIRLFNDPGFQKSVCSCGR
jgi:hypothetical protein